MSNKLPPAISNHFKVFLFLGFFNIVQNLFDVFPQKNPRVMMNKYHNAKVGPSLKTSLDLW